MPTKKASTRVECEAVGCDCEAKELCLGCHMVYCRECIDPGVHDCTDGEEEF